MKAAFFLLFYVVLVSGCASRGPAASASSSTTDRDDSRYAQTLPATDMAASQNSVQSAPEDDSEAIGDAARPYARQLTLQEEIILPGLAPRPEPEAGSQVPETGRPSLDLNNTFTLQLVAMDSMEDAINYARQYSINPEEAGVARILSHGKIYFILAYGVYVNQTQAEQASQELQQKGIPQPWIRRLGTLERLSREADDFQPSP